MMKLFNRNWSGKFPKNSDVMILTSTVPPVHGGRTKSLLERAKLLTESSSNQITILTTNFNHKYQQVYDKLEEEQKINENIKFCNIYDDLMENSNLNHKETYKKLLPNKKVIEMKDKNRPHIVHYFEGSQEIYHIDYDKDTGILHHIDFYTSGYSNSTSRAYVDENKNIYLQNFFVPNTKKVFMKIYYDRTSKPYLIKNIDYKTDKNNIESLIYLGGKYKELQVFKTEKDWFQYWFEKKIKKDTYFIVDARLLDKPVIRIKNSKLHKIFQLHNNHYKNPEDSKSITKNSYKYLLGNVDNVDAIVTLTKKQKNLIIKETSNEDKFYVIPHSKKDIKIEKTFINKKKVVIISRLVYQKRLEDAILAFKEFNKNNEDYTLNIYGEGEDEEKLKKLVLDNHLQEKVYFHGFTNDPSTVFQEASFSIMTSRYEGFCLSIIESLTNGCPVVSYDINFGPSEMIQDGVNGYLVEEGNTEDFVKKMGLLADSDIIYKRQINQDTVSRYSQEEFKNKWLDLLNNVDKNS